MRASSDIRSGLNVKEVDVVVTRRVREEVRKHFGCDQLSGAELEDQGEEGTALTHWEKRLFENEAMTGTHTQVGIMNDHQENLIVDFSLLLYSRMTL